MRVEPHLWGVALSGGEGVRLKALARRILGDERPKQYVPVLREPHPVAPDAEEPMSVNFRKNAKERRCRRGEIRDVIGTAGNPRSPGCRARSNREDRWNRDGFQAIPACDLRTQPDGTATEAARCPAQSSEPGISVPALSIGRTRGVLRSDSMAERGAIERDLLAEIRSRVERTHRILIHAATQLRLGQRAEAVLVEMWKENPELLRECFALDRQRPRASRRMATREGHERPTSRNRECLLCPGIAPAESDDLCAACAEMLRAAGIVRDVGSSGVGVVRASKAARRDAAGIFHSVPEETAEEWSHLDEVSTLFQFEAPPPNRTAA